MENFTNSPIDEQQKFVNMMPDYGVQKEENLRVGFGRRFGAFLIDFVIMMLVVLICYFAFGIMDIIMSADWGSLQTDPNGMAAIIEELTAKMVPISLIVGVIFYSMEIFFAATPGKMALGIIIANADRTRAGMGKLAARCAVKNGNYLFTLLFIISSVNIFSSLGSFYSIVIFLGALAMLSEKKQALHDITVKTAVYFKDELKDNVTNIQ